MEIRLTSFVAPIDQQHTHVHACTFCVYQYTLLCKHVYMYLHPYTNSHTHTQYVQASQVLLNLRL